MRKLDTKEQIEIRKNVLEGMLNVGTMVMICAIMLKGFDLITWPWILVIFSGAIATMGMSIILSISAIVGIVGVVIFNKIFRRK